jgi:predicted transcriptional regulator
MTLGRLERQVMERLWTRDAEWSVRDLRHALNTHLAYTTLMTTVDRLYKKGLLSRRKEGRAFVYSTRVSREDLDRGVAARVIGALLGEGPERAQPVLSCFVDAVSERDRDLLDELERLVREKRRQPAGERR